MLRRAPDHHEDLLFRDSREGGLWPHSDIEARRPTATATETLEAFVNDGRWIVQCPCGSAQLAADRFFCVDCLNVWCAGKWVRVVWPAEVDQIDAALSARPFARNMHWKPGETVADLLAETFVRGPLVLARGAQAIAPGTELHPDSELRKR